MDRKLIIEKTYENIISGIINAILPIVIPSIYSYITKTPLKTIYELPFYIYILLFVPLLFWIIRILIKAKMEEGVEHYLPNYMTKYIAVDNILYKKILWIVEIPDKYERCDIPVIKNHFKVSSKPKCSNCGTELEFTKHDMWYTWKCINCNFVKRTWISKDRLISRAEKKFKRKLELKDEELTRISKFIDMINFQFGTYYREYEIDLIQQMMINLMKKNLIDEIDKRTKDEFKPVFQKYYNKELRNKTNSNETFYNDINNNIEMKNLLEDFLIDELYEKYEFIKLLN